MPEKKEDKAIEEIVKKVIVPTGEAEAFQYGETIMDANDLLIQIANNLLEIKKKLD